MLALVRSGPEVCFLDVNGFLGEVGHPGILVHATLGIRPPAEKARMVERHLRDAAAGIPFLANNPPEIEWNGFFAEGYILEDGSDAEATHARAFGQALESFVTPGYLDGRVFMLYDDCACLVYGPLSENIHGFDERVSLCSIEQVTGSIALFMADWCGLERCDGV